MKSVCVDYSSAMRQHKSQISFKLILFLVIVGSTTATVSQALTSFSEIERVLFSQPYQELPQFPVNRKLFGDKNGPDNKLLKAARRTLVLEDDLYDFPEGQKLLQANGICFSGNWIMSADSGFSGLLKGPLRLPVIARVSVSLGGTKQKDKRAMGMAIKIFPTDNPHQPVETLNIFLMNSMGGVRTRHVLDLSMDNEPPVGGLPGLSSLGTALRLLKDLEQADREQSNGQADAGFRPVSHLAKYGEDELVIAPRWLRINAAEDTPRVDFDDFRDELRLENYPANKISWKVEAAASAEGKSRANWSHIGYMEFSKSVSSSACDRRLHFKHPVLQQ